tara:strand:+ start:6549 stop:7577 length:1029 start_codon:yes stop_codon:yes gene_type:complete
MKAVVLDRFGGPDVLTYRDVADPEPDPGDVVIRLDHAALNHLDLDIRNGHSGMTVTFPHVLGTEGVGDIIALGADVEGWEVGQRVGTFAFRTCGDCPGCRAGRENMCARVTTLGGQHWGAYAELIRVRENQLVALPDALSYADAMAAYKLATAWEGLVETAALSKGEKVLVTGAGGGVGSAAVVVAHHLGAHVIAATGSDDKNEKLRDLGAHEVINYATEPLADAVARLTGDDGLDAVFDVASGPNLVAGVRALRWGGRAVVVGAHGGERIEVDMVDLFRRHVAIHGCGRYTRAILESVFRMRCDDLPKPPVHETFPLAEAAAAQRVMEGRKFFGRLLLNIG